MRPSPNRSCQHIPHLRPTRNVPLVLTPSALLVLARTIGETGYRIRWGASPSLIRRETRKMLITVASTTISVPKTG